MSGVQINQDLADMAVGRHHRKSVAAFIKRKFPVNHRIDPAQRDGGEHSFESLAWPDRNALQAHLPHYREEGPIPTLEDVRLIKGLAGLLADGVR